MIRYKTGGILAPLRYLIQLEGSVIPKAFGWAFCSSIASVCVNLTYYEPDNVNSIISSTWFSYSFLLSFLLVFRTQSAYSRYWEGASTLNAIKGDFLNAASCMFAFCSTDPLRRTDVKHFQHLMVRLMSLLHCSGLQQIADLNDEAFEIVELSGVSKESVAHLNSNGEEKALIVLQWVQKLVVSNMANGVLPIAPPIASRLFQQLGQGTIQLSAAKKISDIPFPFPYTQMVTLLLLGSSIVTPIITGLNISQPAWCGGLTFIGIFGFWSINYIAAEIEMPFGDDMNDLPIADMQKDFNRNLAILMLPLSQNPPSYESTSAETNDTLEFQCCKIGLKPQAEDTGLHILDGLGSRMTRASHIVSDKVGNVAAAVKHTVNNDNPNPGGGFAKRASAFLGGSGVLEDPASKSSQPAEYSDRKIQVQRPQDTMCVSCGEMMGVKPDEVKLNVFDEAANKRLEDLGLRIEDHLAKISGDLGNLSSTAMRFTSSSTVEISGPGAVSGSGAADLRHVMSTTQQSSSLLDHKGPTILREMGKTPFPLSI